MSKNIRLKFDLKYLHTTVMNSYSLTVGLNKGINFKYL